MAQDGFYAATIEGGKAPRRDEIKGEYPRPDINEAQYLYNIWDELGRFKRTAMGEMAVFEFSDLHAYACIVGVPFEYWEAKAIISCSSAYIWGLRLGIDPFSKTPMEIDDERQLHVAV